MVIHIGCSGWNYPHWRETVYPKGLPARRWLEHYAALFDTVEVNNTFYRLPNLSAVEGWAEQTPPGFVLSVKASRYLTHIKRLSDMGNGVARFYERIEPLIKARKLGPVLWQLPPTFRRDDDRLAGALSQLPPGRHAFEFRHESWFVPEVYELLRARNAALVIGDHPERRFQTYELTADWTFVRFHYGRRGATRQLLEARALRMGEAHRRLGHSRRRLRVLQQRLERIRGPQRARAEAAPWGLELG